MLYYFNYVNLYNNYIFYNFNLNYNYDYNLNYNTIISFSKKN